MSVELLAILLISVFIIVMILVILSRLNEVRKNANNELKKIDDLDATLSDITSQLDLMQDHQIDVNEHIDSELEKLEEIVATHNEYVDIGDHTMKPVGSPKK